MNPLLWNRETQHALVIISLFGAIAGCTSRIYPFAILRDSGNVAGVRSMAIEPSIILAMAPVWIYRDGGNVLRSAVRSSN
jgi:hypothetical protein